MKKKIKARVMQTMVKYKTARDNDNFLIAKVLMDMYGTCDMEEIAKKTNESITESITRQRRLLQNTNPLLASSINVSKGRRKKELRMREEMRNSI